MDAQALCREIICEMHGSGSDPYAGLSHDAYIELMTSMEATLLHEMHRDVAMLGVGAKG